MKENSKNQPEQFEADERISFEYAFTAAQIVTDPLVKKIKDNSAKIKIFESENEEIKEELKNSKHAIINICDRKTIGEIAAIAPQLVPVLQSCKAYRQAREAERIQELTDSIKVFLKKYAAQ